MGVLEWVLGGVGDVGALGRFWGNLREDSGGFRGVLLALSLFFAPPSQPQIVAQAEEERASAAGSEKEEAEEEEEEEEYDEEEEEEDDDRPAKKPRHGGFILDEAGELPGGWVQWGLPSASPRPRSAPRSPPQTSTTSTRTRTSGRMGPRTSWRKVRGSPRGFGGSSLWLRGPPSGFGAASVPLPALETGGRGWKRGPVVAQLFWG